MDPVPIRNGRGGAGRVGAGRQIIGLVALVAALSCPGRGFAALGA
jgi:hypothetical protein